MKRQSFVKGAAILTLAGASARFVGAFFRIFLAVLIGDEGMGLFQMAYPVYVSLLAVSTAGVPIAISKLVAENLAYGNYRGAYKIFRVALTLLGISGLVVSLGLYFSADFIARVITQDTRAYYSLVSISPAILLVTVMSAYRGFFQGQQQMMPTAFSQIVEQVGRVASALLLAALFLPRGLEFAAAGASFGAAAGAFCGLALLLVVSLRQRKEFIGKLHSQRVTDREKADKIIPRIVTLAVPITLGSLVMPLIAIVDLFLVPQRLHDAGLDTSRATALYGQLTGMASPLVNIPTIVTVALAISLVPAISEALALKKSKLIQERSYLAVRLTLLLALPSTFGLFLLAEPITSLLFQNAEAGRVLAVLSLCVVFLTLFQVTSAILQGLGRTMIPVTSMLWGAAVKTILTWYLTALPALNISGAAMGTVAGFGVAALLNLYRVYLLTGMPLRPLELIIKPLFASLGMAAAVLTVHPRLASLHTILGLSLAEKVATLGSVFVGALVFGLFFLLLGGVRRSELLLLPRIGEPLANLLEKLHLLRG
ncbi:MAG: polysaccharide biosynthesis protein [Clostridium sp.]|nr:polysaccharide biosynthesis protein [Clostridium sp.]